MNRIDSARYPSSFSAIWLAYIIREMSFHGSAMIARMNAATSSLIRVLSYAACRLTLPPDGTRPRVALGGYAVIKRRSRERVTFEIGATGDPLGVPGKADFFE